MTNVNDEWLIQRWIKHAFCCLEAESSWEETQASTIWLWTGGKWRMMLAFQGEGQLCTEAHIWTVVDVESGPGLCHTRPRPRATSHLGDKAVGPGCLPFRLLSLWHTPELLGMLLPSLPPLTLAPAYLQSCLVEFRPSLWSGLHLWARTLETETGSGAGSWPSTLIATPQLHESPPEPWFMQGQQVLLVWVGCPDRNGPLLGHTAILTWSGMHLLRFQAISLEVYEIRGRLWVEESLSLTLVIQK